MELPVSYKESMRKLLGEEYDAFIATYDDKPRTALRVNTSRITCSGFEKAAPFPIEKIPYITNGYYIDDTDAWAKHPYYYAGLYYIQEPSAMLPASILPVKDGDIVCDLCAAPGGKSTELSCRVGPLGAVLANDISFKRCMPLVKNMELFGNGNYMISCEDPHKLSGIYRETFDCVLVDAPCSGEGMFRKDPGLIGQYVSRGPEYYSPVQRDILECAYLMTCRGGYILYSTCTFSDIEDEQVVLNLLRFHEDLRLCDIDSGYGLSEPYGMYSDTEEISGCVHAFPHRFVGEGHFIALIRKEGERGNRTESGGSFDGFRHLPGAVKDFTELFSDEYRAYYINNKFMTRDGYIYMMTDAAAALYDKTVRYARTGTCIGQVNKAGRFVPHTSLALSMRADSFNNTVRLSPDDAAIIRYLKGETIIPDSSSDAYNTGKGYVLVCVDEYPLGFALSDGSKLKNLYEKGWVYR